MIVAVALCPSTPLLLPGVRGGPVDELTDLDAACAAALTDVLDAAPDRLVVVGVGEGSHASGDPRPVHRFAPRAESLDDAAALPVGLAVGAQLTAAAGRPVELVAVAADLPPEDCRALGATLATADGRIGLLVLGDGSARRGAKAPGYVDARADAFDAEVTAALDVADADALLHVDPVLAADLLAAGRPVWQVLAGVLATAPYTSRRHYADDPFGVWYCVHSWRSP